MARKERNKGAESRSVSRPAPKKIEPTYKGRSTFKVAQALRTITAELPDVMYTGRARAAESRPSFTDGASAPSRPARRSVSRPVPKPDLVGQSSLRLDAKRDQPLEDKPQGVCKKRPTNNRGNGGSRSFVPWCKKG